MFIFDDFKFQLQFYPNGRNQRQTNDLVAQLCIQNLTPNSDLSAVVLDWTLYIRELGFSQIVRGRHHSDLLRCRGFIFSDFAGYLEINGMKSESSKSTKTKPSGQSTEVISTLTFEVAVTLKSVYNSSIFLKESTPTIINRHNTFNCFINDTSTLEQLQLAQHQQTFTAPLQDIWYLTLSPNGFHEKGPGSMDLILNLLVLPPQLKSIQMQCMYKVQELHISHSLTAAWSNTDKGWGWQSGRYPLKLLTERGDSLKSLNITVECDILKLTDLDGNDVMKGQQDWDSIMLVDHEMADFISDLEQMDDATLNHFTSDIEQQLNAMLSDKFGHVEGTEFTPTVSTGTAGFLKQQLYVWKSILCLNIAVAFYALVGYFTLLYSR